MTHREYPFFKRSLNKRNPFYFTAYLGEIEWMALHGWLSDLEELSGSVEGSIESWAALVKLMI